MTHELYAGTAKCSDLPSLARTVDAGIVELDLTETDAAAVVAAVAAEQAGGGRLEEKVDGCWCCGVVGSGGILGVLLSRSGIRLRQARYWEGISVGRLLAGWTLIGELEAGTSRARARREIDRDEDLGDELPPWHIFSALTPDGRAVDGDALALAISTLAPLELQGRLRPVAAALPWESWGTFATRILAAGGEGLVIRRDGKAWRAKQIVDVDRYVSSVSVGRDRRGRVRLYAETAVCISAGRRPRYRSVQRVELPIGTRRQDVEQQVVTITGASMDMETGVIRHARITEIRNDKTGTECLPPWSRRAA